jgi:hypothetical protein
MTHTEKNTAGKQTPGARPAFRPASTTKSKVIKIALVIVFVIILVGVIRVVRYTKHNLPPSTALLPVPAETLEPKGGKGEEAPK